MSKRGDRPGFKEQVVLSSGHRSAAEKSDDDKRLRPIHPPAGCGTALDSIAILIIATAICGVATGLGYRGSLQVANQVAPEDRRAEVVSSYLICCFAGNALPVIGIGVISTLAGPNVASLAFAATIAAFALVALFFGARYLPK